jgi:hypothetical protein
MSTFLISYSRTGNRNVTLVQASDELEARGIAATKLGSVVIFEIRPA